MPNFSKEKVENALENETNSQILELTSSKISQDKNDILQKLQLSREKLLSMTKSLRKYRYIENIDDIILGNYIRWINLNDPSNITITNGAFVNDFIETPETVHIQCKNRYGQFFNVNAKECLIFQKLNAQEETLLAVINYLNKK